MLLDEKKELLYRVYTECLDLEVAQKKINLSVKDYESIVKDKEFLERLAIYDAGIQLNIVQGLIELSSSENESIRLKSIIKLGEIYYKKKFNKSNSNDDDDDDIIESIPDKIILTGRK